ncbi:MAG: HAMP domain-containing sensor histidine kinase [Elusimicrobiota bacterium]
MSLLPWDAVLRGANLLMFLVWLQWLRAGGLLVSLEVPAAVFGLYILANAALLAVRRGIPANARVAFHSADIFLIAWAAHWTSAPFSGASVAMFPPVVLAARTLKLVDAAAVAGIAGGLVSALALWGDPGARATDLACVLAALALAGAAAAPTAPANDAAPAVRSRLGRNLLFKEFLNHILFQVREYLTSITTVTEHLALSAEDPGARELGQKLEKLISELNGKVGRMLDTVKANTTSSRTPKLQAEFELEPLIRGCLASSSVAGAPPVRVDVKCDPSIGRVQGDIHMVAAALCAVFTNSFEAFSASGSGSLLKVRARKDGDAAVVEVVDDAGGVSPEDLKRVFQPLFTTKSGGDSVGLGLSMSRRMLERTGGTVTLESSRGKTRVRVRIPLRPALPIIRDDESTWARRRQSLA